MRADPKDHTIVIGAGLSGLAAAKTLHDKGIPVTVLEAAPRVANPWRARHPQLRLDIHRHFARLPGVAMPRSDGTFVHRDTVVDYLEHYARQLNAKIVFDTHVTSIARDTGGWRVGTDRGEYTCANLVVATGRDRIPTVPIWPGMDRYGGKVVHAADFGDIGQYVGRKVLVVGAGNSGTDVLNHLSRIDTAKIWVSVRHGPAILPTWILGIPLQRLAKVFTALPKWSLDPAFWIVQRLAFVDLSRFGLRRHPMGGATRMRRQGVTFALDDGFVAALKAGRVEAVAETVGFEDTRVQLADGRRIDPDIVVCATGYRSGLEPLFADLGVLDGNGQPRHPMGQPDPDHPGLWFTGYTPGFPGYFHAAGVAADRIAHQIILSQRANDRAERRMIDKDLGEMRGLRDLELEDMGLSRADLSPKGLAAVNARRRCQHAAAAPTGAAQ